MLKGAVIFLAGWSILGSSFLMAQTGVNAIAPTGILPGTLGVQSNDDEISLNSGNLLYQVPMYRFPGGPGSVPMSIGLVYNSFIWQLGADSVYYGSTTGGGWNYSFDYQLAVESVSVPGPPTNTCTQYSAYQVTVVFPDGSRHILRPYISGVKEFTPDDFFGYGPGNLPACNGTYSGQITYFSDDGTYVQAVTSAPTSNVSWTVTLPNGTSASFNPTVCSGGQAVPSWSAANWSGNDLVMQANLISDRNGNTLTVCPSVVTGGYGAPYTQFTVTDQAGRKVILVEASNGSGQPQDTMTAPGANGSMLTWIVNWASYSSSIGYSCPVGNGTCYPATVEMVQNVQLPIVGSDNLQYQFSYFSTDAQLETATTPYGATVSYTYPLPVFPSNGSVPNCFSSGGLAGYVNNPYKAQGDPWCFNAGVGSKTIAWTDPTGTARSQEWQFVATSSPKNSSPGGGAKVTGPDGGVTEYDFCNSTVVSIESEFCNIYYPNLDATQQVWAQNCAWGDGNGSYDSGNPFLQTVYRTVGTGSGANTAVTDFVYDRNGNVINQYEWDWESGTVSTLPSLSTAARTSTNVYYYTTGLSIPGTGSGCPSSTTSDSYDYWIAGVGPVLNSKTAASAVDLAVRQQLTQYQYDSANTTANVTSELQWRSRDNNGNSVAYPSGALTSANAAITAHTYKPGGVLWTTTDPDGNTTTNSAFQSCSPYANGIYPATVTLADTYTVTKITQTWDCSSGLLLTSTDPNFVETSKTYDNLGRPTLVSTGATARQTSSTYAEPTCTGTPCVVTSVTPVTLTTARDLNTTHDMSVLQTQVLDQRGQVYTTQTNNIIHVETLPKLGDPATSSSYEAVSNPYLSATGDTTMGWTRTVYDNMGRPIETDHFNGATLPYPWVSTNTTPTSKATISYSGNTMTVTDEVGNSRTQTTDGLGRLSSVAENPTGLDLLTTYTYDVGNNLTGVNQSGRTRTFVYDSVNRLYQATNPESGTVTYSYDAAGNLLTRKDGNSVTTTNAYDSMNRVTSRTYTGGAVATPTVTYCYDGNTSGGCAGAPNGTGCNLLLHLTMVSSSASVSDTSCYDQFGMPLASSQITAGTTYSLSYTYNMLSEITSETYPSGRMVSTGYDSTGRATSVTGQGVQNYTLPSTAYASGVTYAPSGAVSAMTLGNTLVQTNGFNTRFQQSSVTLGSVWSTSLYYCPSHSSSCSTNNGNLQEQDFTSQGVSYVQSYGYDALNRINLVGEVNASTGDSFDWSQTFLYDSFGNRAVNPGYGNGTVNAVWTATATSQFNSNNQFIRGTGDKYDGAGNEIWVASSSAPNTTSNTMTYDGENRMVSANIAGTGAVNYTYDGDGRRVTKSIPATTVYVYDAAGTLAAEYPGVAPEATGTVYLTGDHLGSTRLVTSAANTLVNGVSPGAAGTVVKCYDYMPFGEDIESGVGSRGSCYPSGLYPATPDVLSVKFTGKERDAESGLDFLGARYLSSAQGRFSSADPMNLGADPGDPQSWNAYSYTGDNPVRRTDPDGLDYHVCLSDGAGGQQCSDIASDQAFQQAAKNPGVGLSVSGDDGGGVIYSTDQNGSRTQVGTYQYFVGPGAEGGGMQQDFGTELAAAGFGSSLLDAGAGFIRSAIGGFSRAAGREVASSTASTAGRVIKVLENDGGTIHLEVQSSRGTYEVMAKVRREGSTLILGNCPVDRRK